MNTVYNKIFFIGKSPIIPDLIDYFNIVDFAGCNSQDFDEGDTIYFENYKYVACIGSPKSYLKKYRVIREIESKFYKKDIWTNLIDSKYIEQICGVGNIVMENCFISKTATINNHNLILNNVTVHHGSSIGNCVTLCTGVVICGDVVIRDNIFIGTNSVIKEHINICDNVLIGANSFVNKDITESGVYAGSPARRIR